jgi:hypothetical protein
VNTVFLNINIVFSQCTNSTCSNAPLLYNSTTGKYGYVASGNTTNSGFNRQILFSQITADELKVSSTVFWNYGTTPYSTTFSESMFNWAE